MLLPRLRDQSDKPEGLHRMSLLRSTTPLRRFELLTIAVIAVLFIVVFPALNAAGVVSNFTINLWGKYLCYALLAISVDLLWGYTGLLSLGQALFFALEIGRAHV